MSDPNKHYVVVENGQVEDYLLRGYARSTEDLRAHLPELENPEAFGLVLMETGKAEFVAANSPPVRYETDLVYSTYISGAVVARPDVLRKDDESPGWTYVGKGDGATRVRDEDMFETPREAAAFAARFILDAIEQHRVAISELEAFLRRHEVT